MEKQSEPLMRIFIAADALLLLCKIKESLRHDTNTWNLFQGLITLSQRDIVKKYLPDRSIFTEKIIPCVLDETAFIPFILSS